MMLVGTPRGMKALFLPLTLVAILLFLFASYRGLQGSDSYLKNFDIPFLGGGGKSGSNLDDAGTTHRRPTNTFAPPKYKPTPTWTPEPVIDPFPLLALSTAAPPPIPPYNAPRPGLHREYNLTDVPPLFIGFTRQWPMLLQCVVGYITAGWPPESIFVVENTGVQMSNNEGKLTLQNPFYLNHTTLRRLGVNVLQTPVLLTFSQLQNFFLNTAHQRSWQYYFYSHQDVLVYSFEDGPDHNRRSGDREWHFYDKEDEKAAMNPPPAGQPGYRTIYENCLLDLQRAVSSGERWAFRWYQYDFLTLVNRDALDAVGGWDSLMPYYMSDCDMNVRLAMDNWSKTERRAGLINDVSTVLEDLSALYRVPGVELKFIDPNPGPPKEEDKEQGKEGDKEKPPPPAEGKAEELAKATEKERRSTHEMQQRDAQGANATNTTSSDDRLSKNLEYFRRLSEIGLKMNEYKYRGSEVRNSWQVSQRGGQGEPYYYPPEGFGDSFWILTEAGREVYRQKWGHRDCDIIESTALQFDDMWRVQKDWE